MTTIPPLEASSRILYEEAQKMGIACTLFGDRETMLMELGDKKWYTRGSRTSFQSSVGKTIADKKNLTKLILQHHGLPTAKHCVVKKAADLSKLSELTFPIVMKPLDLRYGRGVIVGIQNVDAAEKAYRDQTDQVLFEEMLLGTEYRVICVDYKFVAAAHRQPANVVGDGTHTIEELIEIKNQHPWRGNGHESFLTKITIDAELAEFVEGQDLQLSSIISDGQEVRLRKVANLSTGGEAWDVSQDVCDENKKLFENISRVCDLNIIGIDMMCQDLQSPIIDQAKAGVIEVNASPGLRMHHYPIKGESVNVAKHLLEMCLQKAST